ncbi:MAG: hypothetical protein ACH34V_09950 [Flavobacterium sp.]|uniref:hypothetical protein n=1 Tax=Flavobacterium sp. TaxID=239 RepID=UPI0037B80AA8
MRNIFLLIIFLSQLTFSQGKHKKTFRMVFMAPETIEVPTELSQYKDSIVNNRVKGFYGEKEKLKELIAFTDYPEEMKSDYEESKKDWKIQLKYMDSIEPTIKFYEFYNDMLYSVSILNMAFNEYEPYSEIKGIEYSKETEDDFESYCTKNNVDYFMFIENFVISKSENDYTMTSNLKLYSLKEKKVIVEKVINGDTKSHGDMWTCGNPLSCLMITTVKDALKNVIPEIVKRQR